MEIPIDRHLIILQDKLRLWQNTEVDAADDVALAQHIGNEQMEKLAIERAKQAMKAVRWIEERMATLENSLTTE